MLTGGWSRDGYMKGYVLGKLLEEAGRKPEECLMVGDSGTDAQAALENGIPFLGVSYGYGIDGIKQAVAIADNVMQLSQLIVKNYVTVR